MTVKFPTEFFVGNRKKLLKLSESSLIVLSANGLLQRSADTTFPFRQDSNFWYLTGVEEPDFVLVLSPEGDFLIAPHRHEHRDQWDGSLDVKAIKQTSGIDLIYEHHEGWTVLDKILKKQKKVHTIAPVEAYFEMFGFYANPARGVLLKMLEQHKKLEIVDIRKCIASLRQIKQPIEIEAIQRAIDITAIALGKVRQNLQKYGFEYELEADITAEFIRNNADGHAYTPIIAAGKNAATIHYTDNNAAIATSDLLLFDVGAEVSNYSADISRTYAAREPSARQQAVYDAVSRVQQKAFGLLRPGVKMREYDKQVDVFMAEELKALGLLNDVGDKKKLKKYYPHLVSHFLGLDTHDSADYDLPLAPGMVLTVEPGIYIPEEEIGVRIEDDVLVTEYGIEILSAKIPTDL